MRIAFSGAQCSGKTTLIDIIETWPYFKNYNICTGTVRKLMNEPFCIKINKEGDEFTQYLVLFSHTINFMHENVIADRCFLDAMVYATYQYRTGKLTKSQYNICLDFYNEFIRRYDYIFYLQPEFDIVSDGIRSIDKEYQKAIDDIFIEVIQDSKLENVHKLSGDVKNRLIQFKRIMNIE